MKKPWIIAEMRLDTEPPYAAMGNLIPIVVASDHPRFRPGTRLDYGFVQVALREGYNVTLRQPRVKGHWRGEVLWIRGEGREGGDDRR